MADTEKLIIDVQLGTAPMWKRLWQPSSRQLRWRWIAGWGDGYDLAIDKSDAR